MHPRDSKEAIIFGSSHIGTLIIVGFVGPMQPDIPGCILCVLLVLIFAVISCIYRDKQIWDELRQGNPNSRFAEPKRRRMLGLVGIYFVVLGCIPIIMPFIFETTLYKILQVLQLTAYVFGYGFTTLYMWYMAYKIFSNKSNDGGDIYK